MNCHKIKILFVLKKRSNYGPSFGLKNSCLMVSHTLKKYNIDSQVIEVIDGNDIDRYVHRIKPTIVILEAIWCPPYKVKELTNKYKNIKWFLRLHSDIPFLAREGIAIEWIKEYWKIGKHHKNLYISGNSLRINNELELSLGIKSLYLPNIYYPERYPGYKEKKCDDYLDIACLGAIRELKAHLSQALAAIIYGNQTNQKIRFHINGNRLEGPKTDSILKNIINLFKGTEHKLVIHDWMTHHELIELIQKQIDIGMAVSFSETYCIQAYDYVVNNVPIVGSNEIKYILSIFKADPTNYQSIVDCLKRADHSRKNKIHYLNRILLHLGNNKAIKEWLNVIFENITS